MEPSLVQTTNKSRSRVSAKRTKSSPKPSLPSTLPLEAPEGWVEVEGAQAHNLKKVQAAFPRGHITVVTGVSGSGKSSLVFDTILQEAKHRFFSTLSHFDRGLFSMGERAQARKVSGLSLAISLEQSETAPSSRSTVATLSDIGELLGVLWSRFCNKLCPEHGLICGTSLTPLEVNETLWSSHKNKHVALIAPVASAKKGLFKSEIKEARKHGFEAIIINGQVYPLEGKIPAFRSTHKYTIELICKKAHLTSAKTFQEILRHGLRMGKGRIELREYHPKTGAWLDRDPLFLSSLGGCPRCGYAWPELDSRYFSANSLGRCPTCDGRGTVQENEDLSIDSHLHSHSEQVCPTCHGTGLDPRYDALKLQGHSLRSLYHKEINELKEFVEKLQETPRKDNPAWERALEELHMQICKIQHLGLGHLNLARRIAALSGGERQRLRLSNILIEPLSGVLYILDEPSQGLHPADLKVIWQNILTLKKLGNTLIIVDHDEYFIRRADLIIDMGPGGGLNGGQVMAIFPPQKAKDYAEVSATARFLSSPQPHKKTHSSTSSKKDFLTFSNINFRHLNIPELSIQKQAINVVSGVSGVGKTSLVMGVLAQNLQAFTEQKAWRKSSSQEFHSAYCSDISGLEDLRVVSVIDRKPMAKSTVSMPATYLGCMSILRDLYAKLPQAQMAGLTKRHFSLSSPEGRCPHCQGKGVLVHSMKFLADAKEVCPSCGGKRYQDYILAITYKGYSIADLLSLTLEEVYEIFKNHRLLKRKLEGAIELGLGYLIFGQPSISLSGGEAQRLKLATYWGKMRTAGEILLIDEPTRGLHDQDVEALMKALQGLVNQGTTLVIVEHHPAFIQGCDWLIDLGNGPGKEGGKLVFQGAPQKLISSKKILAQSLTARCLLSS